MKIEVKENKNKKEYPSFPCFARHRSEEKTLVLFTSLNEGFALSDGIMSNDNLLYSKEWVSVTNLRDWEILPAGFQVILTQT